MVTYGVPKDGKTLIFRDNDKAAWQVIGDCETIVQGWRARERDKRANSERVKRRRQDMQRELEQLRAKVAKLEATSTPDDQHDSLGEDQ